jgi:hypothetical protein
VSKLKSVKFWITIFCLALLSYIVIGNRAEFISIADKLVYVPLAYLPANVLTKWVRTKQTEEK